MGKTTSNKRTSLGYPIVVLCHGDPVALNLDLHMLQQFIDEVGVGVGNLFSCFWNWVVAGSV